MGKDSLLKVLVTGGAGFIGSNVADGLIEEGYEVIVVDDLSNGREENISDKAVFYKVDIRDKKLEDVMFDAKIKGKLR